MEASRKPWVQSRDDPRSSHCHSGVTLLFLSLPSQIKAGPKVLGPFCGEKAPRTHQYPEPQHQILFNVTTQRKRRGRTRGWRLSYKATGNTASPSWVTPGFMLSPHGVAARECEGAGLGLLWGCGKTPSPATEQLGTKADSLC